MPIFETFVMSFIFNGMPFPKSVIKLLMIILSHFRLRERLAKSLKKKQEYLDDQLQLLTEKKGAYVIDRMSQMLLNKIRNTCIGTV